ncbi:hypothetical protein AFM11_09175 [Mycolicibacterium wolinskyi]|uniref:Acyltransferase n=1 Tax=Mycolicibacterium wolinskyi TaxID=59750 RepID=A0A132PR49_9MYCO|nr:acyltransferase family protein [Mycolicibacterium wolinskyi]KWX24811.1 hypothetical protein AFM11_09175 [Mycolicibacterium wolinskyi]
MTQAATVERHRSSPQAPAGYRPDVEGLRAVAVLLVMLTHAGLPWTDGGFVGVDVFFVISGFLITRMLVNEARTSGRLRMRRFYARRARRLLPAAAVVLVASAVLTWAFLPQNRWVSTGHDIMASAVYAINWRLAAESVNYLRADSAPSIVQHYWSLAVEEQFYILWPCLMAAAVLFARLGKRRNLNGSIMFALALVGLPSLLWSIYYTQTSPERAYFVTTTRMWELALGAVVAMLAVNRRFLPRGLAVVTGWLGLGAIIAAGVLFTPEIAYPGWHALVPTVGAAAIIWAGLHAEARPKGSAGWVLGQPAMEWIGRLSYSIYLCHWPVLIVAIAVMGPLSPVEGLIVVFSSIVPAYLLHHHIENPIRFSKTRLQQSVPMLQFGAITMVISLTAGIALCLAKWPPAPPFVPPAISQLAAAGTADAAVDGASAANTDPNAILGATALGAKPLGNEAGSPKDTSPRIVPAPDVAEQDFTNCTQTQENSEIMSCTYGKTDSQTVVVLVGDSHANQWVPALSEIATRRGWKLVEYTKAACSFTDALITTNEGHPYPSCHQWGTALRERLIAEKPALVVTSHIKKRVMLGGKAEFDAANVTALAEGLRRNYEALNKAGIPVLVIQDTPRPTVNIPECVQTNPTKLTECAGDRSVMVPGDLGAEQFEAKAGLPDVRIVDLNGAICPTEKCAAVIGNVLVYRDASHLTGTYVRTLGPRLEAELGPALR